MLKIQKSYTETTLISDCLKGKQKAQKEFYVRFSAKMLGVCRRYISELSEAEHVMVGSIMKALDKINQFSTEGSLEGWVRKITVNECLMYLRKNKSMWVATDLETAHNLSDINGIANSLEIQDLLNMIDELPSGYRTVFNLYAIEGYSHQEIAKSLNISENTSKSQLSRARKHLQMRLSKIELETLNISENGY